MGQTAAYYEGSVASVSEIRDANVKLREQVARRVVGQEEVISLLTTAFFAGGHCLLVGVPGLAKTLLIRSFASTLGLNFNRIQFTPDLMPSDVTGADIIGGEEGGRGFEFLSGPIFSNIILADEINRTPPKTQSAMLEAMEEYQVTAGGRAYPLPQPFFVMATQNPIEQEGTYQLPLAALDRFLFHVNVDYPALGEELDMLFETTSHDERPVEAVVKAESVMPMLRAVRNLPISDDTLTYATRLVRSTRPEQTELTRIKELVEVGGSPRAVQALILGAKARAALEGRPSALPSDVRAVALPAMRHRIVPSFHAAAESITTDDIIRIVLKDVPRPSNDQADPPPPRQRFNLARWLLGTPKPRKLARARA